MSLILIQCWLCPLGRIGQLFVGWHSITHEGFCFCLVHLHCGWSFLWLTSGHGHWIPNSKDHLTDHFISLNWQKTYCSDSCMLEISHENENITLLLAICGRCMWLAMLQMRSFLASAASDETFSQLSKRREASPVSDEKLCLLVIRRFRSFSWESFRASDIIKSTHSFWWE